jgi:hypothetical protein
MKKTLTCMGLVLVMGIFAFTQTATAFEQGSRGNRVAREARPSHEEPSPRGGSREEFRENHGRQEVHYQQPAHYEHRLPAGYRTLRIANMILYYLNGMFYQSTPYGYQVVNAPMGSIVGTLPPGYYQVLYGGTLYYVYNNTYYVQGPMGYNVVTPPQGVMFPIQTGW